MPAILAVSIGLLLLAAGPEDMLRDLRSPDGAARLRAVRQIERQGADAEPSAAHVSALIPLLVDADAQTRGLATLAVWRHLAGWPAG